MIRTVTAILMDLRLHTVTIHLPVKTKFQDINQKLPVLTPWEAPNIIATMEILDISGHVQDIK